jgi:hypothetical protein
MQLRVLVMVAAFALAGGLWCGSVLGVQNCPPPACNEVDGIPVGKMTNNYCVQNNCSPGSGWCRTETCAKCNGNGATTNQCQSEDACKLGTSSLCSDTCGI